MGALTLRAVAVAPELRTTTPVAMAGRAAACHTGCTQA